MVKQEKNKEWLAALREKHLRATECTRRYICFQYIFFMKMEIINNGSISAVKLSYCRNAIDFSNWKSI